MVLVAFVTPQCGRSCRVASGAAGPHLPSRSSRRFRRAGRSPEGVAALFGSVAIGGRLPAEEAGDSYGSTKKGGNGRTCPRSATGRSRSFNEYHEAGGLEDGKAARFRSVDRTGGEADGFGAVAVAAGPEVSNDKRPDRPGDRGSLTRSLGCCAGRGQTARPPCDSASRLSPAWSGPAAPSSKAELLAADRSHPTQLGSERSHAVD